MRKLFARHPSPALVISLVALIAALAGTAVGLPGHNRVRSDDIKTGAVKRLDQAGNQRTDWALIDLSNGQIIRRSPGVTLTSSGQSFAYVNFHHDVSGRPIVATVQWPGSGDVRAVLCGSTASEEDTVCFEAGANNHNHVYVDKTPSSTTDTVYVAVLPK